MKHEFNRLIKKQSMAIAITNFKIILLSYSQTQRFKTFMIKKLLLLTSLFSWMFLFRTFLPSLPMCHFWQYDTTCHKCNHFDSIAQFKQKQRARIIIRPHHHWDSNYLYIRFNKNKHGRQINEKKIIRSSEGNGT